MCDVFKISRGMVYYKFKTKVNKSLVDNAVIKIFRKSKNNYGTRKIKVELEKVKIGFSSGAKKDAKLVEKAFLSLHVPLYKIEIFHTDRGREFKNLVIDNILKKYMIKRSLSKKGSPYDNVVVEATYKIIKTEFVNNNRFETEEQLALGPFEYVNWYNNIRIHSSLNYLTPLEFKESVREKVVL